MSRRVLRTIASFFVSLFCVGCAAHHPLLVRDQEKRIRSQDKQLKAAGALVQDKIAEGKTTAALVIVSSNAAAPPSIYTTDDPILTATDHAEEVRAGQNCFLVFARDLALSPEQLSCRFLATQASRFQGIRQSQDEQKAQIAQLSAELTDLTGELARLSDDLRRQGDILESHTKELALNRSDLKEADTQISANRTDLSALARVVGPATTLITFHDAQLQATEKMLQALVTDYQKAADAVGQNNQQIDSLIKDLNASFAQVKSTLDQMQQKLATIK